MSFDQGEFDFDTPASEHGYRDWQAELDARRRAFEKKWGIILARRVRVTLRDRDRPLEGVLQLVDEPGKSRDPKKLRLHLAGRDFLQAEIESIVRID